MTERIQALRAESVAARPSFSAERAVLTTEYYQEWCGKLSTPMLRAGNFFTLCDKKTIYIGPGELIVGERGPRPKAVSSFPELTCHSEEDLRILSTRPMTSYAVSEEDLSVYRDTVIPYWRGRSMRDRAFSELPASWIAYYEAACFTEFMEQRAPGHTALDGTIYRRGLNQAKAEIAQARATIDWAADRDAWDKDEELKAMALACDAAIRFAERHAELAESMAALEADASRAAELKRIAELCRRVPAEAPRDFWEALQAYWFCHLGTITELNGWDAMSPGRLDLHLGSFYESDLKAGRLTREKAKELLSCFWIKVNNTPAPPKVGVTAAESGTYNDFTNINLGGLTRDGDDASGELSYLALEVLDELRLLQPQANIQLSAKTPARLLTEACRVIRNGNGYPSLFNADEVAQAMIGMGKDPADAREGGTSGCIETGCFGKEAYILHGYLNLPKVLLLALNDGVDADTGKRLGPATGDPRKFSGFDELYAAIEAQLGAVLATKLRISDFLDRMYARLTPAPFLSALIEGCIGKGRDYYDGGAKYNTDYIQFVGLGTITDSLAAISEFIYGRQGLSWDTLLGALAANWGGQEELRLLLANKAPKYGNDDERADAIAVRLIDTLIKLLDGRPSPRGGAYHIDLLSTTCHVYFGLKTGATPDGRRARLPMSDGTSPSQGADRKGPTAVMKSLGKLGQARTGGTLLNQRFLPGVLEGE
ncbi:MAG TPA: formate C-acetyltransferase/glycerol dehydratase family glycyl radical enzyme, partial [Spirochaetaceae bacterium]|nr:formate C-acetyltransferase/glycerol dehydratase family glycyl radical enzyme [Spirochaetaceae bacterium]